MREKPRACKTADEIAVGDRVTVAYAITDDDLRKFAEISGDWNPLHFDDEYAGRSMFRQRIAHGMISLAKFSGIFGMDLPGTGTLWETQEVRFVGPVFLNTPYLAVAEVTEKDRRRVVITTWVEDENGTHVLEGKAHVIPIGESARKRLEASLSD
jgi:3-hydroxybutyryl-CoA dehydratase